MFSLRRYGRPDGGGTFGYGKGRGPLGAEDVQTDAPVAVDIWVIDFGRERNL